MESLHILITALQPEMQNWTLNPKLFLETYN
jgi:hypothetical protein